MMWAVFSSPSLRIFAVLCLQRSLSSSTPDGLGVELLRRHDDDAAVAAAQVEHLLAGLEAAELQHLLDDGLRRGVIGRQFLDILARRGHAKCEQDKDLFHTVSTAILTHLH